MQGGRRVFRGSGLRPKTMAGFGLFNIPTCYGNAKYGVRGRCSVGFDLPKIPRFHIQLP